MNTTIRLWDVAALRLWDAALGEVAAMRGGRTGAVWSVARGLARNVKEYKELLANCDLPRRNDLDGRGALSE